MGHVSSRYSTDRTKKVRMLRVCSIVVTKDRERTMKGKAEVSAVVCFCPTSALSLGIEIGAVIASIYVVGADTVLALNMGYMQVAAPTAQLDGPFFYTNVAASAWNKESCLLQNRPRSKLNNGVWWV